MNTALVRWILFVVPLVLVVFASLDPSSPRPDVPAPEAAVTSFDIFDVRLPIKIAAGAGFLALLLAPWVKSRGERLVSFKWVVIGILCLSALWFVLTRMDYYAGNSWSILDNLTVDDQDYYLIKKTGKSRRYFLAVTPDTFSVAKHLKVIGFGGGPEFDDASRFIALQPFLPKRLFKDNDPDDFETSELVVGGGYIVQLHHRPFNVSWLVYDTANKRFYKDQETGSLSPFLLFDADDEFPEVGYSSSAIRVNLIQMMCASSSPAETAELFKRDLQHKNSRVRAVVQKELLFLSAKQCEPSK